MCATGLTTFAAYTLKSPSGRLELTVDLTEYGQPWYSLSYDGRPVINQSRLGIIGENHNMADAFSQMSEERRSVDETWKPVWGQTETVRNNYNELLVRFRDDVSDFLRGFDVRFRLFDDGLGFRYEFPKQDEMSHWRISEEITGFNLPGNPVFYATPGDYESDEYLYTISPMKNLRSAFESKRYHHSEGAPVEGLVVQTPLLVKTEGEKPLYINIHEANLRDYGALLLDVDEETGELRSHIVPDKFGVAAYVKLPFHTPWRTVMVSDDARDILASNLIYNLNEPSVIEDTSWIKPVKFMGVWWEMFQGDGRTWAYSDDYSVRPGESDYSTLTPNGRHPANTENVKRYIDFAADHHIPAVLVEGWNEGWEDWGAYRINRQFRFDRAYPDFDVEELTAYADSKGVELIMHHETAGNATDYERQLDNAFRFMNDNGYKSVKTGYVGNIIPRDQHHGSQNMVNHYIHVADRAKDYKIAVDSHEAVRPTGLMRTYPNWLAQESARGGEFESMGGNPPEHTVILPFTRLVGGPMDYTPGLFEPHPSHVSKGGKVEGGSTLAKQLALYLTMPSPVQMACDLPENYENYPDAFRFIEDVPVEWRDSKYLEAEPAEYITVARLDKNSDNWYVGTINGRNPRTAVIDFGFLPAGHTYTATIYQDGDKADYIANPTDYKISTRKINSKTRLKIPVVRGGGAAIRITPDN